MVSGCALQGAQSFPSSRGSLQSNARHFDASRRVVLLAFDTHANRLDWTAFRQLEENGQGSSGDDDALVDPTTLILTQNYPLFSSNGSSGGDPALTLPAHGAAALSLAWPTRSGYSNLILDLPGRSGTYDFDELAAAQVLGDISASLAARPWYREGTKFAAFYASAKSEYARAQRTKNEARSGALFARSLDAGVSAETLLLAQAGVAYAATHSQSMEWGATFDTITGGRADLKTAADSTPKTDGFASVSIRAKSLRTMRSRSGTRTRWGCTSSDRSSTLPRCAAGALLPSSGARASTLAHCRT